MLKFLNEYLNKISRASCSSDDEEEEITKSRMYFIDYKHFFYFSSFKSLETPIQNVDI